MSLKENNEINTDFNIVDVSVDASESLYGSSIANIRTVKLFYKLNG